MIKSMPGMDSITVEVDGVVRGQTSVGLARARLRAVLGWWVGSVGLTPIETPIEIGGCGRFGVISGDGKS